MSVDLDAARRARAERLGSPDLTVGGKKYLLRADMPLAAALAYDRGTEASKEGTEGFDFDACAREVLSTLLLDQSDVAAVMASGVSWYDLSDILTSYHPVGESSASPDSSTNGGKPSRPTSRRSTPAKRPSRKQSGTKKSR